MLKPYELVDYTAKMAVMKGGYSIQKTLILSFAAGVYIAMAGLISMIAGYGVPEITAGNPLFSKLMMGLFFPVGLVLVLLTGAELFTGNTSYFIPAVFRREQSVTSMLKNWILVWCGNFIGALFFGYFFVHLTHTVEVESLQDGFAQVAYAKTHSTFWVALLKGVACNWLVCLAIWVSITSPTVAGKIVALWGPVLLFVGAGYEHSVANMFFLPMAMFSGVSDITVGELFVKNLIPVTIGNIIGGALFVGGLFWYSFEKLSSHAN